MANVKCIISISREKLPATVTESSACAGFFSGWGLHGQIQECFKGCLGWKFPSGIQGQISSRRSREQGYPEAEAKIVMPDGIFVYTHNSKKIEIHWRGFEVPP